MTHDKARGIHNLRWASNGEHILYVQDEDGDENHRIYSLKVGDGTIKSLTPQGSVQARIIALSPRHPDDALVGLNDRDPKKHDLYRINIRTGATTLVAENPGFITFVADENLEPRVSVAPTTDGGFELFKHEDGKWESLARVAMEDTIPGDLHLSPEGTHLYLSDARGRDTGAISRVELATGKTEIVVEDTLADITEVIFDPATGKPQAAASNYKRKRWHVIDSSIQPDFDRLKELAEGDFQILDRSGGDRTWLIAYDAPQAPLRYYLYDRDTKEATLLIHTRPELSKYTLSTTQPVTVKARDGLTLVGYVTLPPNVSGERPGSPLPTVMYIHGGPWARDSWGFNAKDQWLANRGYAVLRVNFRGSLGFGKSFINAANKEWAGAMHNDVLDFVSWAIKEGIADRERTMVMGGSYGGYATLVGLTFTPDVFACGVARVAWSNLASYLEGTASYNQAFMDLIAARVGDPRSDDGRKLLMERSPITHAKKLSKPLLIAQGANDPRSKPAEAQRFVDALGGSKVPVVYMLYTDEGHFFRRPESRISFNAATELFLKDCLGGRAEAINTAFEGANFVIKHGVEHAPWLTQAAVD
ncbi:MAG: S9 family peptidase [Myxococcota bacterium]